MKLYAYNVELYALSWPKITRQPCKLLQNPPPPVTMLDRLDSAAHITLLTRSQHGNRGCGKKLVWIYFGQIVSEILDIVNFIK